MANKERDDERRARQIVESITNLTFNHWDKNGEADYISSDGVTAAVEVTRITTGERRKGRDAARSSWGSDSSSSELLSCWVITVSDTQPNLKNLVKRVIPHLIELEIAGVDTYFDQTAAIHVIAKGPNSVAYRGLLEAGVLSASSVHHQLAPEHVHIVSLSLAGGGTSGGSDAALEVIELELRTRPDNIKKLLVAGAKQSHLFVWIDYDTDFTIARPLQGDAPTFSDHFGLPSRTPQLESPVSRLWVVHEGGRGWYWDGASWRAVDSRNMVGP